MRRDLTVADLGDLAGLRLLAVLATYRRDGSVLLSPVWHEWRDGGFHVVTGSSDVMAAHLRRDSRASIVVCEHTPPYRGGRGAVPDPARHRSCRRCGTAHYLAVARLGPHASTAQATIFLSAWNRAPDRRPV